MPSGHSFPKFRGSGIHMIELLIAIWLSLGALQIITLRKLNKLETKMSQQIDDLTAAVAAEETVEASCIALLSGLAAQLAAANTVNGQQPNPAITSVISMIQADTAKMAAAVAAFTPAPVAVPAPDPVTAPAVVPDAAVEPVAADAPPPSAQ